MKMIPILLPKLASVSELSPYLKTIDENRYYSNKGPLLNEFIRRIGTFYDLSPSQIVTGSNGTHLLELCLRAFNIKPGSICLLPSWTFIATPLAAVSANLQPYFIDVDVNTQTFSPSHLLKILPKIKKSGSIGAVIVTSPFGQPINCKEWDQFTEETKIPVLIDGAAAFDTTAKVKEMQVAQTPIMISLHATKIFGIGEGGLILSKNEDLIANIQIQTQFGCSNRGDRVAISLGTNSKLSEYSAAAGLANIDVWSDNYKKWSKLSMAYQDLLGSLRIKHMQSKNWITSTFNIYTDERADICIQKLNGYNIASRKWWGNGCHNHPVFKQSLRENELPNTEYLQRSVVGIPFFLDLKIEEISLIGQSLETILSQVYETT